MPIEPPTLPAALPKVKKPIFRRLLRQSLAVVFVTVVLLGSVSFSVARSLLAERTLLQLSAVASARKAIVEDSVRKDRERTALIAARADIAQALVSPQGSPLLLQLEHNLVSDGIPVEGLTLFSVDRRLLQAVGTPSPARFPAVASTVLVPSIEPHKGWTANDVYSPLFDLERRPAGYLGAHYRVESTLAALFADTYLGKTGTITLGLNRGGEISVVQDSRSGAALRSFPLGDVHDPLLASLPLTRASMGLEGVEETRGERGEPVFAAERFLPSLGWGLTVELSEAEAFQGLVRLGITYAVLSALLLCFGSALAYLLGRRLTLPVLTLSGGVKFLAPGRLDFARSIRTGDEVEVLESAIADLTSRLKMTYDHLEQMVTERTAELQKQYVLDRRILESIDYGILTVDPQGMVSAANPASLRLLQQKHTDVAGKKASDVLVLCEKGVQCPPDSHPLLQVLRDGDSYRSHPGAHMGVMRKDQTILPVTLTINPLVEGASLGAIVVFQDMTLERQLDYMKSEFISLASHQLRTPLSSIRWYMELLAGEGTKDFTPSEQAYIEQIEHASRRMANLLEALLHVARLEGGAIKPEYHQIEMAHFLQRVAEEWQMTVKEKQLRLHTSLLATPQTVCTDPVLLQVILQNLLSNALKYSSAGGVIDLSMELDETNRRVMVSVADHGVGIPVDEQPRLFEKFFRARNVRHMDTDGTGLGLYICKSIAESVAAQITFQSAEGKGSTFTITLPLDLDRKCEESGSGKI